MTTTSDARISRAATMRRVSAGVVLVATLCGCSRQSESPASTTGSASQATATPAIGSAPVDRPAQPSLPTSKVADDPLPPVTSPYDSLPEGVAKLLDVSFTGDFDEMVKRRVIRVGTVFNRTHYFVDRGQERGLAYEGFKRFEDDLNAQLKSGLLKVHVVMVPLLRDQLFVALQAGKVDLVAAALTITPERLKLVGFSTPTRANVSEIVVTGPGGAKVATPDDLSGREVFVRKSSSYYESLVALNASLAARGRPAVVITEAPEPLEDDDLLEMVNAGLVDATVMDDYMVEFWRQVFPAVQPQAAVLRAGGELAIGVRKNNPRLRETVNTWMKQVGRRSTFANVLNRRYLQSTTYVKSAAADAERKKLQALVKFFQVYGERYKVDYLLMAAQGYQESQLDQSRKSRVGAIGVMQVMPATGQDLAVGDITKTEPNIHAGVKYFRFMMDEFYKNEPMDDLNKGLMTLASYNAGPGRIRQLRRETAQRGLDPNKWFGNVERTVSERIGRETVTYVSNIYKYYIAYRLVIDRNAVRQRARQASGQ
jgi:membrane-bound lytic murein transglycosylase MltF